MDLKPLQPKLKSGEDAFRVGDRPLDFSLKDFWRWSVSDLVSNATRGRLAEFIVARALGISTEEVRDEWRAFDLATPEGIKVEVKSAAYVQSWYQRELSKISFLVPPTCAWDAKTNRQSKEKCRHADVYVFALLAHQDKKTIDPLDISQWSFFVLSTAVLNARTRSQHSIMLKALEELAGPPIAYDKLDKAVRTAAKAR